jgi:hypothetical protein
MITTGMIPKDKPAARAPKTNSSGRVINKQQMISNE